MYKLFFLILIMLPFKMQAQDQIQDQLLKRTFKNYHESAPRQRRLMQMKDAPLLVKMNPLAYLGAGLMFVYQNVISEQYAAVCNYETSCSEFAKISIEHYGLIKGILLGASQLQTCLPQAHLDHLEIGLTEQGKIRNLIHWYE